ncbi:MAG: hypothetical protein ACPGYV_10250 [Phycisphaeraceae bacterium]
MSIYRSAQQTLSTSYGSAITIDSGASAISVTLDDSSIGFTVKINDVNEEDVPAGSSWQLQPPRPGIGDELPIKIKAASGTPKASVVWFK